MLHLTSVNDRLQVITSAAGLVHVHASWVDVNTATGTVTPGRTNTIINTAATTSVVLGPAASIQRNIKTMHVTNAGGAAQDITVQHTDGTVISQLWKNALNPNQSVEYTDQGGFVIPAGATQKGITDGSNAAPGDVGEYMVATLAGAAAISLLSNTPTAIVSLTLTPGDWRVNATLAYKGDASTTLSVHTAAINNSVAMPVSETGQISWRTEYGQDPFGPGSAANITHNVGPCRYNVTVPTTIYLVATAVGGGNLQAFGMMQARRMR